VELLSVTAVDLLKYVREHIIVIGVRHNVFAFLKTGVYIYIYIYVQRKLLVKYYNIKYIYFVNLF
jgi:hypothetical protein